MSTQFSKPPLVGFEHEVSIEPGPTFYVSVESGQAITLQQAMDVAALAQRLGGGTITSASLVPGRRVRVSQRMPLNLPRPSKPSKAVDGWMAQRTNEEAIILLAGQREPRQQSWRVALDYGAVRYDVSCDSPITEQEARVAASVAWDSGNRADRVTIHRAPQAIGGPVTRLDVRAVPASDQAQVDCDPDDTCEAEECWCVACAKAKVDAANAKARFAMKALEALRERVLKAAAPNG